MSSSLSLFRFLELRVSLSLFLPFDLLLDDFDFDCLALVSMFMASLNQFDGLSLTLIPIWFQKYIESGLISSNFEQISEFLMQNVISPGDSSLERKSAVK